MLLDISTRIVQSYSLFLRDSLRLNTLPLIPALNNPFVCNEPERLRDTSLSYLLSLNILPMAVVKTWGFILRAGKVIFVSFRFILFDLFLHTVYDLSFAGLYVLLSLVL